MAITLSATLPSGTDVQELSANASGGARVGASSSELVSFHGATAVDQTAFAATLSINALSVSGVIGFTSSASFSTAVTRINDILACLIEKGLMAAS